MVTHGQTFSDYMYVILSITTCQEKKPGEDKEKLLGGIFIALAFLVRLLIRKVRIVGGVYIWLVPEERCAQMLLFDDGIGMVM